jgi:menaquinone-dependent protoporphyrinogen oxidase
MRPIGIFYATRHGHTRRIAERIATGFRARAFDVEVVPLAGATPALRDIGNYAAIIVAASVHGGHHEPEVIRFVRDNRESLESRANVLVSVSLSQAGVERSDATTAERQKAAADVAQMIERFVADTGWQPRRSMPVAGALLYTRYNIVMRYLMRWIAMRAGGPTDVSRDHVYTDWSKLDALVAQVAIEVTNSAVEQPWAPAEVVKRARQQ